MVDKAPQARIERKVGGLMKLPKIPYTMDKDQSVQIPFRGIN